MAHGEGGISGIGIWRNQGVMAKTIINGVAETASSNNQ